MLLKTIDTVYTTVENHKRQFSTRYMQGWAVCGRWHTFEYDGEQHMSYTPENYAYNQPTGLWLEQHAPTRRN